MNDKGIINIIDEYCTNNDIPKLKDYLKQESIKKTIICEFNDDDFDSILFLDEKNNGIIIDSLFDNKGREILELFYSAADRVDLIFEHPIIASKLMNQEWFCRILSIKKRSTAHHSIALFFYQKLY